MSGGFEIGLWALLATATITDLIWGKIFNWICLSYLLGGVAFGFYSGGFHQATTSALAIVVAFSLFFPLYFLKALAAGDVKLLMAAAAWTNFHTVLELGFLGILIAALVGGVTLTAHLGLKEGAKSVAGHWKNLGNKNAGLNAKLSHRIPFAPAFLCAFILMHVMERYHWSMI